MPLTVMGWNKMSFKAPSKPNHSKMNFWGRLLTLNQPLGLTKPSSAPDVLPVQMWDWGHCLGEQREAKMREKLKK